MPAPRGNKNNLRHGIHSGGFDPSDLSALAGLISEGLPDEPEVRRLAERAAEAELSLRQLRAARCLHLGEWAEVSEASRAAVYARIMAEMVEVSARSYASSGVQAQTLNMSASRRGCRGAWRGTALCLQIVTKRGSPSMPGGRPSSSGPGRVWSAG